MKAKDKKIEELNQKLAKNATEAVFKNAKRYKGIRIISVAINGATVDLLRDMSSRAVDTDPTTVIVLASINGDKVHLSAVVVKMQLQTVLRPVILFVRLLKSQVVTVVVSQVWLWPVLRMLLRLMTQLLQLKVSLRKLQIL